LAEYGGGVSQNHRRDGGATPAEAGRRHTHRPNRERSSGRVIRTKSRVQWAVAIAVVSGLIAGCGVDPEQLWQTYTSTPRPAKITFADDRHSVFVMNPDGTAVTRIAAGSDPSFASDASRIVVSGDSISTMDPDGSHVTKLADGGYEPTFSPDGTRIAFVRGGVIYVMNSVGHKLKQLTATPGSTVGSDRISSQDPSFSRDGSKIVFSRAGAIWVMASDGTGQRPVLADPYDNSEPVFTPDDAGIVFTSNRGGKNRSEIYAMDADGGHIRPLTDDWTGHPSFSPTRDRPCLTCAMILFTRFTRDSGPEPGAQVWVMNSDGSNPHRLTDPKQVARHPSWGDGSTEL
jgi:TolB protein